MFVYTAYLDESSTHGGSEVTIMGGMLARAEQWERFQKGYDKLKKKHGFRIFHTKKFKNKTGDFKGWSNYQRMALMADLAKLTSVGLTEGVAINLDNATYERHYKGTEKPNKARLDSAYGLCFRMCLYFFVVEAAKRQLRKRIPPLHLVLEAGHRNSGDAERIFLELKKEFRGREGEMLRSLTLVPKDECDPLMVADFIAHSTLMLDRKARAAGGSTPEPGPVPRGMTGITHLQSTPQAIAALREAAIESAMRKTTVLAPSRWEASEEQSA